MNDKSVALPKTRHLDETEAHPTHSIPSVAAIVPAEVPSFKKTILETGKDLTSTRRFYDRPTKSTIQKHQKSKQKTRRTHEKQYVTHPIKHMTSQVGSNTVGGDKRYILKITPDNVSIVPKSKHAHDQVTGEGRRRISRKKHKGHAKTASVSKSTGLAGSFGSQNSQLKSLDNLQNLETNKLSLPFANGLGTRQFGLTAPVNNLRFPLTARKPVGFTTLNNALQYSSSVIPQRLLLLAPITRQILGPQIKRWERNKFKHPAPKHEHNETEEYRHHYGKNTI